MRQLASVTLASFVLALLAATPSTALTSEYQTLRTQVQNNQTLDTQLVRNLPEPSTAEEYWLRSFTRTKVSTALSDLETAINRSSGSPEKYLKTWLDLALLDSPTKERLAYLRSRVEASRGSITAGVWLDAGKYAGFLQEYDLATNWAKRALDQKDVRHEALLDLAEYALGRKSRREADRYLDRYFLTQTDRTDGRYWILRGRYFRSVGSDSEAYVAYSHLVREYPESLVLRGAEQKLEQIALPKAFRPHATDRLPGSTAGRSGTVNETSGRNGSSRERSDGQWVVQLGSFQTPSRARRFRQRMAAQLNHSLVVRTVRLNGEQYHRVQMVGFETKRQALRQKRKLQRNGIDSFILEGSHQ